MCIKKFLMRTRWGCSKVLACDLHVNITIWILYVIEDVNVFVCAGEYAVWDV